jgi:aldehyde dehydrogenase (NAD+)
MQQYITSTLQKQRAYFLSGATQSLAIRKDLLRQLDEAMHRYEKQLAEALWTDLHKSYEEAYLTELSIVYGEIRNHMRHMRRWARPERKASPLAIMPAKSKIIKQPLGNALIIAPWNYPVQLLLNPLVGALSAGCTAMLKPSPYVPNVSRVLTEMIRSTFRPEQVAIVEGNREVNQMLLAERWDIIFFTGSPSLGKMVMEAAAKHLTPVVLELGGKSPCIIDKDADLKVAAKRVAWGKVLNAGQTCIAPDYLMIHEEVKEHFLKRLVKEWNELLTRNPQNAKHFVRIVNDKALDRLIGYLDNGTRYHGGVYDKADRYLSPTILTDVAADSPIMQEEIFGPIFPVMTFKHIEEVPAFVNQRERPLALYYFGKKGDYVLRHTISGGACVNDVIMHIVNHDMPFGGVGNSGMGNYHGKDSFLAFTHRRSVVSTPTWVDMPFRYMPYKLFKWIKKLV